MQAMIRWLRVFVLSAGCVACVSPAVAQVIDPMFDDGFDCRLWYVDADGDGFGNPAISQGACAQPPGFVSNALDCNDADPNANYVFSEDFPDPTFFDADCDGIDGEIDNAVFVAVTGADTSACGAIDNACATPYFAIGRAQTAAKRDVYVAGGSYVGTAVFLANGINLFGGFGSNFQRDPVIATGNRVSAITGPASVNVFADSQAVTIVADALTQPVIVADLRLIGPTTTLRAANGDGKSSHVMLVRNIAADVLIVQRNEIIGGNGMSGADGMPGNNASTLGATAAMKGINGVQGGESGSPRVGGNGGTNSCSGGIGANAGKGGNGGDTGGQFGGAAGPGQVGGSGAQAGGSFGGGGTAGAASTSGQAGSGGPAEPGKVTNGSAGAGGLAAGQLVGAFWYAFPGNAAGIGENGGGGGGGGGGGASDNNVDDFGSSGGGGGAGGCRAPGAAGGGRGGGGSFGIYLINASPSIRDNQFTHGVAASGGSGGTGGRGQSGGAIGTGAPEFEDGGAGGDGGPGGHGGHGGGGGGGASGISVAVFRNSAASVPVLDGNLFGTGVAATGGTGGISAPTAPIAERDGNDGAAGAAGTVLDTAVCASAAGC